MNDDFIKMILVRCARSIAMLSTEELEAYVNDHQRNAQQWDSIGSLLEPTAYRDGMYNGANEDAKYQLAIAEKLLEVRKLIDKRELHAEKFRNK